MPFLFDNESALRNAVATGSKMRNFLDAAVLRETGAKVLWWQAFGRHVNLNNGKPLRTPADMKGKKVRTYGKILGWTVEALGGAPTLMSGLKQFLAYKQKAVDVGMTGISAVKSRKLYEVMNHMTLSFDSAIEFVAVINNKFFEGLSKKSQEVVLKAAATVEKQLRDQIYAEEASDITEIRLKMTVVDLSEGEHAKWRDATKGVIAKFAKAGGADAAAVIKVVG